MFFLERTCDVWWRMCGQLDNHHHGARMVKDILCIFWCIDRAKTTEEVQQALNDLRNCEYWKGRFIHMVNGFEKRMVASNYDNTV